MRGPAHAPVPSATRTTPYARSAARALAVHGVTSLASVAAQSTKELLALHGVGPKAIAILGEALDAKGLAFRTP